MKERIDLMEGWWMMPQTVFGDIEDYALYHDCDENTACLFYSKDIPFERMINYCLLCKKEIPRGVLRAVYTIAQMEELL